LLIVKSELEVKEDIKKKQDFKEDNKLAAKVKKSH